MADVFIGITLPEDFHQEVEVWRRRFAAPKTVPHITVIPPFRWPASRDDLEEEVKKSLEGLSPFLVATNGVGRFGRRVIFIAVAPSPAIMALHQKLRKGLSLEDERRGRGRPYHPHITLATRLSPGEFNTYVEELAGYEPQEEFTCGHVAIFKMVTQGSIRRWQVWKEVPLLG
ncbi:MAG: 2'-5' RNA ligase family protein [Firmicutes bacterium]|nr:2'-5' RNA ligase family protein [Bacillota bacterium]